MERSRDFKQRGHAAGVVIRAGGSGHGVIVSADNQDVALPLPATLFDNNIPVGASGNVVGIVPDLVADLTKDPFNI